MTNAIPDRRKTPSLREPDVESIVGGPVVVLHGLGVDHRMWSLQLPSLQKQGQIFAPDFPGFGETPPLPDRARFPEQYADWLASRMRERSIGASAVVGYSMGGTVALLLALRHPDLVSRLAICCSSAYWGCGWRRFAAKAFVTLGRTVAMEIFQLSVRWSSQRFARDLVQERDFLDMVRSAHRPTMLALYARLAELDLRAHLGEVRVPALVVAGGRDLLAPLAHARTLARELPLAELHVVEGATHLLCLSHSEQLGRILKHFLQDESNGSH